MVNPRLQLAVVALGAIMLVVRFSRNNNGNLMSSTDFAPGGIRSLAASSASAQGEIGAIHVGKCGGIGLRQALEHGQTKTVLKEKKLQWFHMQEVHPELYKTWIVLIRDPIARIQSNYVYEHVANAHFRTDAIAAVPASRLPNKAKFYECYNTLEKFVTIGLAKNPPPPDRIADHAIPGKAAPGSDDCRRLAFGLFDGPAQYTVPGMPHFSRNFEFYTKKLLEVEKNDPETKIWLIRQEHMQEDVETIDRALGGGGVEWHMEHFEHVRVEPSQQASFDSLERKQQMSKHMSANGLRNLCRVLCSEIQYYKALLAQAQQTIIGGNNFVEETLAPLREECPEEVQATECEPAIPPELKEANRAETLRNRIKASQAVTTAM